MHLEAKVTPRPAKVAGRLYPTDHYRVNCPLATFRNSPDSSGIERAK
jgi:hypothetical protein